MERSQLDEIEVLKSLLNPNAAEDREGIDPLQLSSMLSDKVDAMLEEVERSIYLLALDSRIIADLFWEEQIEHFEQNEPGKLGLRVRVHKGSLEIMYFRNAFTRNGGSKRRDGKAFYAKHIPRSGRYHYNSRDFNGAEAWEHELALTHEVDHARNRKLFNELSKARRSLKAIKKALDK
ncbi:conjugative transfer protein MobI(A/C) [Vreelandella massiliensis]|uniref:conjugative transfer protein MobI(A/C) n=1 Tax=Vreelandella massiliensis TaxID=1816686 RepID=UPI00096A6A16|nr:conjugative transfer protein MobI(A/C) [Halomonas massiliensis]